MTLAENITNAYKNKEDRNKLLNEIDEIYNILFDKLKDDKNFLIWFCDNILSNYKFVLSYLTISENYVQRTNHSCPPKLRKLAEISKSKIKEYVMRNEIERASKILSTLKPKLKIFIDYMEEYDSENEILKKYYNLIERLAYTLLPLVITIAEKTVVANMDIEERIGNGFLGLIDGLRRYDRNKNTAITTYVRYWIVQKIINADNFIVKPNKCVRDSYSLVNIAYEEYKNIYGYTPTAEELKEFIYIKSGGKKKISIPTIEKCLSAPSVCNFTDYALSSPVNKDNKVEEDFADDYEKNEEEIEHILLQEKLKERIEKILTKEEMNILVHKTGLFNTTEKTWKQLSKMYDQPLHKLQRIFDNAINKIKQDETLQCML